MTSDLQFALSDPNSSIDALNKKYGHLRPGTYDVTQAAYWEKPEFFFQQRGQSTPTKKADKNDFVFSHQELYEFQRPKLILWSAPYKYSYYIENTKKPLPILLRKGFFMYFIFQKWIMLKTAERTERLWKSDSVRPKAFRRKARLKSISSLRVSTA